ncbi:hypothetical protein AKJ09_03576 [Labilithrix luteola]|uniref:Glycosyltransferase RgtA/B/C/D-like domain-containing protein n=1 Tax=Labilithrix luteola TaxID=1391654 RepID=A0A0K1PTR8_9BACT|nr:hypothetical protein [Labilithrix luteola]AKU96912.1 hypothetical protein AKJ09_03576 [Labilithrix luteola]
MTSSRLLEPKTERVAVAVVVVLSVVIARAIGHYALEDVPHVMDEIAYTLQAKTFATGHLSAPVHLPRASFGMWFVEDRTRFFSIFPPGWPAVLAMGLVVGLGAWVNPLLHGATTFVVARASSRLADARTSNVPIALVSALLYGSSPQALLLAGTYMSHTLVAFCASLVLLAGLDLAIRESGEDDSFVAGLWRRARMPAAGFALGAVATSRPLCAVALGLMFLALVAIAVRRGARPVREVVEVVVPAFVLVALLLAYNHSLTGNALRFPQSAFFDEHGPPVDVPLFRYGPGCNDLGFGPTHGCEVGLPDGKHSIGNAFSNTGDNLTAWFYLAGGGPLVFLFAILALVFVGKRDERLPRLVVFALVPVTLALYGLYWYAGTCYGARFYQVALPALVLLAALGACDLARRSKLVFVIGVVFYLGYDVILTRAAAREVGQGYWGTDARFAHLVERWNGPPGLVLVAFEDEDLHGRHTLTTFLHDVPWLNNIRALGALGQNRPDHTGPVVFARFHPGLMQELRANYPDRERWLFVVGTHGPDKLVRYDQTNFPALEAETPPPRENFDGYILPAPLAP